MRNFAKISVLILAALALAIPIHAQTTLPQTTLSAAITSTNQRVIQVASATNITVPSTSGTSTQLYIDDEMLDVTAVFGNQLTVRRGATGKGR